MQSVTLEEAQMHLPELIDAVLYGDEVFITRENGPSVRLVLHHAPITKPTFKKRQFGSAQGLIKMGPDFDEPLEDFKEYME